MIKSISKELYEVQIPIFTGEVKMLPFNLDNLANVPKELVDFIKEESGE